MARYNQDWDDLGRKVQRIIDRAVTSQDYQKLNQTIRQVVDRAVDLGTDAVRRAMEDVQAPAGKEPPRQHEPVVEANPLRLYAGTGDLMTVGIVKIVGGSLLCGMGVLLLIAALILMFTGGALAPSLVALALFGSGGWLIGSGIRGLGMISRFKTYQKIMGLKTHCALEKLAQSVGKPVGFVRKEVQAMITRGLFLEGHLDREERVLITSHDTYRYFEQSRLQLEQRQQQEAARKAEKEARAASRDPQVQEVLQRGNAFIREIRRCNDAIPGAEISEKISRMEMIVGRIFERAEAHPEIVPDLKKLMDYYLPMTVKLLNAYADMDAQPVQGPNIENAKREIEQTLDTLNQAFEKLLDSVFADTALDISSDISVLHTLLAQEGLTEDPLEQMRKQKNQA